VHEEPVRGVDLLRGERRVVHRVREDPLLPGRQRAPQASSSSQMLKAAASGSGLAGAGIGLVAARVAQQQGAPRIPARRP
jgi:hypothetical protein